VLPESRVVEADQLRKGYAPGQPYRFAWKELSWPCVFEPGWHAARSRAVVYGSAPAAAQEYLYRLDMGWCQGWMHARGNHGRRIHRLSRLL
jgi:hypothetical protein